MANRTRGNPQQRLGVVVSNRMSKTVVVEAVAMVLHPMHQKYIRRVTRFKAHDELGCQVGDRVEIVSTRPLSKTKTWRVRKVVEKGKQEA